MINDTARERNSLNIKRQIMQEWMKLNHPRSNANQICNAMIEAGSFSKYSNSLTEKDYSELYDYFVKCFKHHKGTLPTTFPIRNFFSMRELTFKSFEEKWNGWAPKPYLLKEIEDDVKMLHPFLSEEEYEKCCDYFDKFKVQTQE